MDLAHPGRPAPTYALIDLDPGTETTWDELLTLARLHRTALEHLGVRGYPKVTGQRGIQIWIPILEGPTFAETRAWVEQISRAIGGTVPDLVSWKWDKQGREGRARLDYTQNAINKTLVAPYSPRPAPRARRSRRRSAGTSSTTPTSAPTAGPSAPCWNASGRGRIRWRRCSPIGSDSRR